LSIKKKKMNKKAWCSFSKNGTIFFQNFFVNHLHFTGKNHLTGIGIYGLWLAGLTIVESTEKDKSLT